MSRNRRSLGLAGASRTRTMSTLELEAEETMEPHGPWEILPGERTPVPVESTLPRCERPSAINVALGVMRRASSAWLVARART